MSERFPLCAAPEGTVMAPSGPGKSQKPEAVGVLSMNLFHRPLVALILMLGAGAAALASPPGPAGPRSQGRPPHGPARVAEVRPASARVTPLKASDLAEILPWFVTVSIREVTEGALVKGLVDELQRELKTTDRPPLQGRLASDLAHLQKWLETAMPGPGRSVERGQALRNAFRASVRSLDEDGTRVHLPHQYIKAPEEEGYDKGGVGLMVDHERDAAGRFVVVETLDGFPAQAAGIRPGDRLVRVGGHPVKGMTYREMADLVRGELGTRVGLEIERAGTPNPIKFAIERVWINPNPKNISSRVLADGVGYIRIKYLGERLHLELEKVLDGFKQQNVRSVVLDLRNNDGLLGGSVDSMGCFVPKGTPLATLVTKTGPQPIATTGTNNVVWPLVVLVNRYSGGAAILLAGALRDAGRAQLVGEATTWRDQPRASKRLPDGSTISVTTGYYTLPKGQVLRKRTRSVVPEAAVKQEPLTPLCSDQDEQMKRAVDMSRVQQTVQAFLLP